MKLIAFAILALSALSCASRAPAEVFDHVPELGRFRAEVKAGDGIAMAMRTERAIDRIVKTAHAALAKKGAHQMAAGHTELWEARYKGRLVAAVAGAMRGDKNIDDYPAMSAWLDWFYKDVEGVLGKPLAHFLRIDDINTLNHTIPVVFHLQGVDAAHLAVTQAIYTECFVPFCGVVSYWSVWVACEVATWGAGWTVICTPAAMLAEQVATKLIAPQLAPVAYRRFYPAA